MAEEWAGVMTSGDFADFWIIRYADAFLEMESEVEGMAIVIDIHGEFTGVRVRYEDDWWRITEWDYNPRCDDFGRFRQDLNAFQLDQYRQLCPPND